MFLRMKKKFLKSNVISSEADVEWSEKRENTCREDACVFSMRGRKRHRMKGMFGVERVGCFYFSCRATEKKMIGRKQEREGKRMRLKRKWSRGKESRILSTQNMHIWLLLFFFSHPSKVFFLFSSSFFPRRKLSLFSEKSSFQQSWYNMREEKLEKNEEASLYAVQDEWTFETHQSLFFLFFFLFFFPFFLLSSSFRNTLFYHEGETDSFSCFWLPVSYSCSLLSSLCII